MFRSRYFSDILKSSVVPIYKKKKVFQTTLVPVISTIFEHITEDQLSSFFEDNQICYQLSIDFTKANLE